MRSAALPARLGAVPLEGGSTRFRVWAPAATSLAVRVAGRGDVPLRPGPGGTFECEAPAVAGDDYLFLLPDGRALPDPQSRWQPEGLRGPSRVLDPDAFEWTDAGWEGVALRDLVDLRAARRHLHGRRHVRRRHRRARRPRRPRRHRDRAHADRDLPRRAGVGLRRRLHVGAAPGLRRPGRLRPVGRRRPRPRARGDPRRRLQPRRPGIGGPARVRQLLHGSPRDLLGRRARLLRRRRARVGDPERRALGGRLPRRRPAPRRHARDLRRRASRTSSPSSLSASVPSTRTSS